MVSLGPELETKPSERVGDFSVKNDVILSMADDRMTHRESQDDREHQLADTTHEWKGKCAKEHTTASTHQSFYSCLPMTMRRSSILRENQ
jgi:hypothetical protein